jgi:hypothetical protein
MDKYVYLIRLGDTDVYKIGFSKNPKNRIKYLQTANPYKLTLVDSYLCSRASLVEGTMHRRYNSMKVDENEIKLTGEFFRLDNDTVKKFKETCEKINTNFKIIEEMSTLHN